MRCSAPAPLSAPHAPPPPCPHPDQGTHGHVPRPRSRHPPRGAADVSGTRAWDFRLRRPPRAPPHAHAATGRRAARMLPAPRKRARPCIRCASKHPLNAHPAPPMRPPKGMWSTPSASATGPAPPSSRRWGPRASCLASRSTLFSRCRSQLSRERGVGGQGGRAQGPGGDGGVGSGHNTPESQTPAATTTPQQPTRAPPALHHPHYHPPPSARSQPDQRGPAEWAPRGRDAHPRVRADGGGVCWGRCGARAGGACSAPGPAARGEGAEVAGAGVAVALLLEVRAGAPGPRPGGRGGGGWGRREGRACPRV